MAFPGFVSKAMDLVPLRHPCDLQPQHDNGNEKYDMHSKQQTKNNAVKPNDTYLHYLGIHRHTLCKDERKQQT